MSKLGKKHRCGDCGAPFYDLNRPNPTCPKCGALPGTKKKARRRVAPTETATIDREEMDEEASDEVEELNLDVDMIPVSLGGDDGDDDAVDTGLDGLTVDDDEEELPDAGTAMGVDDDDDEDDLDDDL